MDNRVLGTILLPIMWMMWIAGGAWAETEEGLLVDEQWIPASEFRIVDNMPYLPLDSAMTDYLGLEVSATEETIVIDRLAPRTPLHLGGQVQETDPLSAEDRVLEIGGEVRKGLGLMKAGGTLYLPLSEEVREALSWQWREKTLITGWRPSRKVWLEEVGTWLDEKAATWRSSLTRDALGNWHGQTEALVFTVYENGDEVIGTHVDGSLEGVGLYRWERDGTRYVGGFRDDQIHGVGRYTYAGGGRSPVMVSREGASPFESNRFTERQRDFHGEQPVLLVAVSYRDVPIRSGDDVLAERLQALSAAWSDMTGGQHLLVPASEQVGTVDDGVVGVTIDRASIGGVEGEDFMEAVLRPLADTVDFDAFDRDDDGVLAPDELHIILLVAGRESEKPMGEPSVLSHRRRLSSDDTRLTQWVDLPGYVVIGEIWETGELTPLGVFLHELAHNFGLPDLYGPPSPRGVGVYSLMARGYMTGEGEVAPLDAFSRLHLKLATAEERPAPAFYSPEPDSISRVPLGEERYVLVERGEEGLLFWIVDEGKIDQRYDENRLNADPQDQAIRLFRGYRGPYFPVDRPFLVGFEGKIFRSEGTGKLRILNP